MYLEMQQQNLKKKDMGHILIMVVNFTYNGVSGLQNNKVRQNFWDFLLTQGAILINSKEKNIILTKRIAEKEFTFQHFEKLKNDYNETRKCQFLNRSKRNKSESLG